MLMFNTDESVCKGLFEYIYEFLDKKEGRNNIHIIMRYLKKKEELYSSFLNKKEQFKSNIKITSTNANFEIKDKMEDFERREKGFIYKNNHFFL